jgi:hypothetical protein
MSSHSSVRIVDTNKPTVYVDPNYINEEFKRHKAQTRVEIYKKYKEEQQLAERNERQLAAMIKKGKGKVPDKPVKEKKKRPTLTKRRSFAEC